MLFFRPCGSKQHFPAECLSSAAYESKKASVVAQVRAEILWYAIVLSQCILLSIIDASCNIVWYTSLYLSNLESFLVPSQHSVNFVCGRV